MGIPRIKKIRRSKNIWQIFQVDINKSKLICLLLNKKKMHLRIKLF